MFLPLGQLVCVPVHGKAYVCSPGPINQGHSFLAAFAAMPQSQAPTAPDTFPDLSASNSYWLYPLLSFYFLDKTSRLFLNLHCCPYKLYKAYLVLFWFSVAMSPVTRLFTYLVIFRNCWIYVWE